MPFLARQPPGGHGDIYTPGGNRSQGFSRRTAVDLHLRPRGHWNRQLVHCVRWNVKGKTFIIATRGFTNINFSIFPEMVIYFQHQYDSPKTNTATSEKNAAADYSTYILVSSRLILSSNLRSPMRDHFNNNILIENHYEVCLILIKEIIRFISNLKYFPDFRKWIKRNYTPRAMILR